MPLPELWTARLRLRPFEVGDVDAIHALWTDPGVRRFLPVERYFSRRSPITLDSSALTSTTGGALMKNQRSDLDSNSMAHGM